MPPPFADARFCWMKQLMTVAADDAAQIPPPLCNVVLSPLVLVPPYRSVKPTRVAAFVNQAQRTLVLLKEPGNALPP